MVAKYSADLSQAKAAGGLRVVEVKRRGNGRWTISAEVKIEVDLGDGRTIKDKRIIKLGNLQQQGRLKS